MSNFTIANASNIPLNTQAGSIPNMIGAILDWLQPMTFIRVQKNTIAYQLIETTTNINFQGVIQPLTTRELQIKPEGERAWSWFYLIAQATPSNAIITLNVDEVVVWNGVQTRIMSIKDYGLYGFIELNLVQSWLGSGPPTL